MSTMNQEAHYRRMTQDSIPHLITQLAIPTIISMLVTSIYNMADTYFVGTISTSASGATGIVFSLMSILQAFGFMFGHGAGANISQQLGSKNVEKARIFASTSFFLSILVGAVVMVVGLIFMDPMMRIDRKYRYDSSIRKNICILYFACRYGDDIKLCIKQYLAL